MNDEDRDDGLFLPEEGEGEYSFSWEPLVLIDGASRIKRYAPGVADRNEEK